MNLVIIVLGILYLCGVQIGKALAICAIVEGALILFLNILKVIKSKSGNVNEKEIKTIKNP